MPNNDTRLGSGRTNTRTGSIAPAQAKYADELLLFCPASNEIIVVPKEGVRLFMEEANKMELIQRKLADSRGAVIDLEQRLQTASSARYPDNGAINQLKTKLGKAQNDYETAYGEVKKELGDEGYLSASPKDLMELIPLKKRKAGGEPVEWGRKWTYVRPEKVKSHWRKYKLNKADQDKSESFIQSGKIDKKKLHGQFTKLEPKVKAEWKVAKTGVAFPKLQEWADILNIHANENKPIQFGTEVQLFRYFAGCGASAEWNPKDGKIGGKVDGSAEITLAHGGAKVSGYLPGPEGWAWSLTGMKTGKEYLIGNIRGYTELDLEASAGASVAAELSLEVDYSGGLPKAKGAHRPKSVPATARKVSLDKTETEASAGADAFAGVKAGCGIKLAAQSKTPEQNEFEDMASIGPKVIAQFGAGAAASLMLTFDPKSGKFRFKAKAGVCLGPGAKGELGLEVDAKQISAFLYWMFYALLNADFETLEVIEGKAYKEAMRLQVLMVSGVEGAYANIQGHWDKFIGDIDTENRRIDLMNRILSSPRELSIATPEVQGILLYQMTRHGKLTDAMPQNTGWHTELLANRKEAVLQICHWAQTRRQFENMVQHMAADGGKGDFSTNYQALLEFMKARYGISDDYDGKLQALYARLPNRPSRGYKVAMNDTATFTLHRDMGDAPVYLAMLSSSDSVPSNYV